MRDIRPLSVCFMLLASAGCSSASPVDETSASTNMTFEEFEAKTYREPITGLYIVEGDVALEGRDALRAYFDEHGREGALIVNQARGVDTVWNDADKLDLSYCVSTSFGANYAAVVEAMRVATSDWMSSAFVRYRYVASEDGACNASNARVKFDVNPTSGAPYFARSFFPNTSSRSARSILIDSTSFASTTLPWTVTGILKHELGHTLGFRHEHLRPEAAAGGICPTEDTSFRAITAYDGLSVMHYPRCHGLQSFDLALTSYDRYGAERRYPFPRGAVVGLGGNCLGVGGIDPWDERLVMFHCTGGAGQTWSYSGSHSFGSVGKLLTLGSSAEAATPRMSAATGTADQTWRFVNAEIIGHGAQSVTLKDFSGAPGTGVVTWRPGSALNQKWTFDESGRIAGWGGMCLDVYASGTQNGTPVLAYACHGGESQKFHVATNGEIRGIGDKCLTIENVSIADGARLVMWECNGGANQRWSIIGDIRGAGDKCLDVYAWGTSDQTPVLTYACHGGTNQRFRFNP